MSEQTAQEPTMEEILASIRRIISEDDAPAEAAPQAAAPAPAPAPEPAPPPPAPAPAPSPALMDETPSHEEDDVLELTQRWEEPAAPAPVEHHGDLDISPRFDPPPPPRPEPAYSPPPPLHAFDDSQSEGLVGDRTAGAAASAFSGLAQSILMPREGRQLEDLVKELMKPMLKDWLDRNLPAIVEAQVRIEVERIGRMAAR